MNIDIPKGARVYSPEETYKLRYIEETIKNTFKSWGYCEILLPYFEYFDVHKKALGQNLEKKAFKLIDRYSGEVLSLRADFTAQIARYIATLKTKELPYRLFYSGTVFRYEVPKGGKLWENLQAGVELIGLNSISADVEILSIVAQSLKKLKIDDFQIDLSSVKIFHSIKQILKLTDTDFKQFIQFVKNKEIYSLEAFVEEKKISGKLKEFIVNLPLLQGDITLINQLKQDLREFENIYNALKELKQIYLLLEEFGFEKNVGFDLSEVREFEYYTGIIFEIFIKGHKKPVGQGGRYDSLIGKFDGNLPSVGFAFDLVSIFEYLKEKTKEKEERLLVVGDESTVRDVFKLANTLRERKNIVEVLQESSFSKEKLKNLLKKYDKVFHITVDKGTHSVYIYSSEEDFEVKNLKDFI